MWAFHKNRDIRIKIDTYLDAVLATVHASGAAIGYYAEHGMDPHFAKVADEIHAHESRADQVRRDIELALFAQSLLPESREDLFLLLEQLDMLANRADDVCRQIVIQQLTIPETLMDGIEELMDIGIRACEMTVAAAREALGKAVGVSELVTRIKSQESIGDQVEHRLVQGLFAMELATAEKILYRDIITQIGSLCDLTEGAALRLSIFVVKRRT